MNLLEEMGRIDSEKMNKNRRAEKEGLGMEHGARSMGPMRFLDFARNDGRATWIPLVAKTPPLQRRMVICLFPTPAT